MSYLNKNVMKNPTIITISMMSKIAIKISKLTKLNLSFSLFILLTACSGAGSNRLQPPVIKHSPICQGLECDNHKDVSANHLITVSNNQPSNLEDNITESPVLDGISGIVTIPSNEPPKIQGCVAPRPMSLKILRDSLTDGSKGPEMVEIPAGTFKMGDMQSKGSQPMHSVKVNQFAIGRYEVTFVEYDRFAKATGRDVPDDSGWGRENRPVIQVSWEDASAYAEWLSKETSQTYRLPTEAEWEYAARAGTDTQYWWGDKICQNLIACCNDTRNNKKSSEQSVPVGSFPPNPFGLYDTAGNVWEWTCSEYKAPYNGKEERHCVDKNTVNDFHIVARGGSWYSIQEQIRSAYRFKRRTTERYNEFGFRVVREINEQSR